MSKRPNILFIYPDQLRYDCMSVSGNPVINTPAFDKIANEGVNFTNAYTSFPLCCPFRASVMTGKYAHNHGLYTNHYPIPTNQEFLPEIMNRNGYATGWIGKWHLNGGKKQDFVEKELRCGFETFIGFSRGHNYDKSIFYRNDDRTPRKTNVFEPVYQTKHLFEFIDDTLEDDKPFFAGICYGMPHYPNIAPQKYLEMYDPNDMPISPNVPKEMEAEARDFLAKYYGLTKMVDDEVIKVLDGLKERNLLDNTMIIFASDHGELAGEYGKYDKLIIQESSMHVPFMIRYPKEFKPSVRYNMIDPSVDIFPTILDVCGIDIPEYAEGISLIEQCEQKQDAQERDYVYFENIRQPFDEMECTFSATRGLRTREYCYLADEGEPVELYDLRIDPHEQNNVVDKLEYKDIVEKYHERLLHLMKKTNDSWDVQYDEMLPDYQSQKAAVVWSKELFEKAELEIVE